MRHFTESQTKILNEFEFNIKLVAATRRSSKMPWIFADLMRENGHLKFAISCSWGNWSPTGMQIVRKAWDYDDEINPQEIIAFVSEIFDTWVKWAIIHQRHK